MKIILDGVPVAQARMRLSRRGGMSRVYDPQYQIKNQIKKIVKEIHGDHPLFESPRVSFIFHMPIPKSITKKQLSNYKTGLYKHQKKPDVDNLIKLYLDCIDGTCFDGDQKVSLGPCVKLYHTEPKTIILISETDELLTQREVDLQAWELLCEAKADKYSSCEMAGLRDFCNRNRLAS